MTFVIIDQSDFLARPTEKNDYMLTFIDIYLYSKNKQWSQMMLHYVYIRKRMKNGEGVGENEKRKRETILE